MPFALNIGIEYSQFWLLNPRKMKPFEKAYRMKQKQLDGQMWMMGAYVLEAVGVSMANAFSKKGRKVEYRKKPFMADLDLEPTALSEEQKIERTNALFSMLSIMQSNFNNSHGV